jgi:hypothetical protein
LQVKPHAKFQGQPPLEEKYPKQREDAGGYKKKIQEAVRGEKSALNSEHLVLCNVRKPLRPKSIPNINLNHLLPTSFESPIKGFISLSDFF